MSASARLGQLGIALPEVVAPLASYVPAVRTGNLVYTSGQLPMAAGQLLGTGKVGAQVSIGWTDLQNQSHTGSADLGSGPPQ